MSKELEDVLGPWSLGVAKLLARLREEGMDDNEREESARDPETEVIARAAADFYAGLEVGVVFGSLAEDHEGALALLTMLSEQECAPLDVKTATEWAIQLNLDLRRAQRAEAERKSRNN